MNDDVASILKQLAKTAVLVAAVAALLYGAVTLVAELHYGRWLIGLVLAAPLAALITFTVFDALRTGIFPLKGSAVSRDHQPRAYWFNVGWFVVCGVLLGVLAAWSGAELMAAVLDRP